MPIQILYPFLNWVNYLFTIKLYKFFMYSGYKYLIWHKISPLLSGLSFYFLEGVLLCTMVFNFDENQFIFFVTCALDIVSNKALPNPSSQRFTPMFSLKSLILLTVTFRWIFFCYVHFMLVFCVLCEAGVQIIFFSVYVCNCLSTFCWKVYFFFIGFSGCLCQKSIDYKYKTLFLDSGFHSIDLYAYPYAITTLSWFLWLCNKCWTQKVWIFQFCP